MLRSTAVQSGFFRLQPLREYGDLVYDLGRLLAHNRLWFRRFIPRAALMPAAPLPVPIPIAHESRHVRQERANHIQRRRTLRRRFVQELAK